MSDLSPQYAEFLEKLQESADLWEARRRCEQFLRMTDSAVTPSYDLATPEGVLSALLSGEELPDADQVFGNLTGRVYANYTVAMALSDSGKTSAEALHLPTDCWCISDQNRLILMVASSAGPVDMAPLTAALRKYRLSAGISRPFYSLSELRQAHQQAAATLQTIHVLGRDHTVAFYDDFLMIRLLEQIPEDTSLSGFCLPDIQALQEYDKNHDSELCRTLLCYLEHARNASSTARELNVHRNTVHYRIGKCREVMPNLDFQNDYMTFLLMLSLHIAEYDFYRQQIHKSLY